MRKTKWTKEACFLVASQCSGKTDLQDKNEYVYRLMTKKGWLSEIFPDNKTPPKKYTDGFLADVAKKYDTRNSFRWGDWNFYHIALRRGLLDKICVHMKQSTHTDANVIYLLKTKDAEQNTLYKIGITSKRCYRRRLSELKYSSKLIFEVLYWVESLEAKHLEAQILKMGVTPTNIPNFRGKTEMRIFSQKELIFVEDLLKQAGGV